MAPIAVLAGISSGLTASQAAVAAAAAAHIMIIRRTAVRAIRAAESSWLQARRIADVTSRAATPRLTTYAEL
jgi:hypothetical protein